MRFSASEDPELLTPYLRYAAHGILKPVRRSYHSSSRRRAYLHLTQFYRSLQALSTAAVVSWLGSHRIPFLIGERSAYYAIGHLDEPLRPKQANKPRRLFRGVDTGRLWFAVAGTSSKASLFGGVAVSSITPGENKLKGAPCWQRLAILISNEMQEAT